MNDISAARPMWLEEVLSSYEHDDWATKMITEISVNPDEHPMFSVTKGLIKYKKRIYIGSTRELRKQLLEQMHSSPMGGHSGQ